MTHKSSPNCLIIAGEKSGEEHALSFFLRLKNYCPDHTFWGVGGDVLKEEGVELLYHLNDFSSWGVSGVLTRIPFYYKALNKIEKEIMSRDCRVAILIDFQTFNLELAKRLKKHSVKVLYYVAPQAWAWKSYRVHMLRERVDTLFTILPFEKKWFLDRGVTQVISAPHPIYHSFKSRIEEIKNSLIRKRKNKNRPLRLLLLPGSREFEVKENLKIFLDTVKMLRKDFDIALSIVIAKSVRVLLDDNLLNQFDQAVGDELLAEVLLETDVALAVSGTVTLITAFFAVPTIVTYRSSYLNEFIYSNFISYRGPISLANIVHEEMVFPEYIQSKANKYNLYNTLHAWLSDSNLISKKMEKLLKTPELIAGDDEIVLEKMKGTLTEAYA